ncbi:uncharacterized protein LOC114578619 [Dendrobium catenatum]|uniref:uncharacterized protein LOC114578619 n=1 Tax=Dendrobium catenatum TaxID=906689 RepID=UPI0010A08798|nr:uncharacterized protein LOC114578619 [Dendrobium catenatum]
MSVGVLNVKNDVVLDSSINVTIADPKRFILVDDMLNDMSAISNSVAIENALLSRQDFDQLEKNGADVSNEHYEEGEFVPPSNLNAKSPTKQGFLSSFLIRARLSTNSPYIYFSFDCTLRERIHRLVGFYFYLVARSSISELEELFKDDVTGFCY